jgi:16S rRNA (cytidine1402-2'-O)-methyltransferase
VENIPGPCAAITALTVSGLPPDKFLFLGYPPEKESHQKTLFSKLTSLFRNIEVTVIFFVSPHKLLKFLNLLKKTMGDREIVLARELTKLHEEVWRGEISAALSHFSRPQGEFVLLFHLTSKANETNRSN